MDRKIEQIKESIDAFVKNCKEMIEWQEEYNCCFESGAEDIEDTWEYGYLQGLTYTYRLLTGEVINIDDLLYETEEEEEDE